MLDRELARLPMIYRVAVVLCELEGRSRKDVAGQLGLPEGTLSSRLAKARRLLARRLTRAGVAPALLLPALACAAEKLSPALVLSTMREALYSSSGNTLIALVTERILQAMTLTKLKVVVGMLLAVAAG